MDSQKLSLSEIMLKHRKLSHWVIEIWNKSSTNAANNFTKVFTNYATDFNMVISFMIKPNDTNKE